MPKWYEALGWVAGLAFLVIFAFLVAEAADMRTIFPGTKPWPVLPHR